MTWLEPNPADPRRNWEKLSAYEFLGIGTPEGVVPAGRGATFRRSDGGAGTCLYVKEQDAVAGDASKGWVPK